MAATLFDHLKNITAVQKLDYWDTLDESSRKSWNSFMIHRFLSMNSDWIPLLADIQPYTEILQPRELYLCLIGLIPKGKHYSPYIKGNKEDAYEKWLIDLLCVEYLCSIREANEYCEILYSTVEGKTHIDYICKKYGVDPKMVSKLKLGLK